MKAYIISYFGDASICDKRRILHARQVEWLLQFSFDDIIIHAIDYEPDDFIRNSRVHYRVFEGEKIPNAPTARNVLLKEFYDSEDTWALFLDNDSVLYPHCDGDSFDAVLECIPHVDYAVAIAPHNPQHVGFSKDHKKLADVLDDNILLSYSMGLNTSLFFHKNIKLLCGQEILFDQSFNDADDTDWTFALVRAGFGIYTTINLILKEMALTYSIIERRFGDGSERARRKLNREYRERLIDKWGNEGLKLKRDRLCRREFVDRHFVHPKRIMINKSTGKTHIANNHWIPQRMRLF